MKRISTVFLLLICFYGFPAKAQQGNKTNHAVSIESTKQSLIAILDTVDRDDQLPRVQLNEMIKKYGWSSTEVQAQQMILSKKDSINTKKVKLILDQYGWLGKAEIGEKGNNTMFLVIQHSDLATQLNYMPFVRNAVKEGNVLPSQLALLEDRTALRQGKKQIYGSQLMQNNKTGKYFVQPLQDPENVDQRRAAVGLTPIKEYVAKWGIIWSVEQYHKDLMADGVKDIIW